MKTFTLGHREHKYTKVNVVAANIGQHTSHANMVTMRSQVVVERGKEEGVCERVCGREAGLELT